MKDTETDTNRSTLPWKVSNTHPECPGIWYMRPADAGNDPLQEIAVFYTDPSHEGRSDCNAKFAERACNSHDALVALAVEVEREYPDAADWKDARGALAIQARAALAAAQA